MKIPISDIKRLTLHDGPGVRDTVFVKGCPLSCLWCHNPESISPRPQLLFHKNLCTNCKDCATVCPANVHRFDAGCHSLDRSHCTFCGQCVTACLSDALTLSGGLRLTAREVFDRVMRDRSFYANGGGVTVSGGEPLLYPEFVRDLFFLLRDSGIHTALDTCGAVPFACFETTLPMTSLILYDLKGMDSSRHAVNTGRSNEEIIRNLAELGKRHIPVEVRMPIIPGCNDSAAEIEAAGRFLAKIPSLLRVRLLAYHSMAREKYRAAGMPDTMPETAPPSLLLLTELAAILAQHLDCEIALPPKGYL
jgi:pyruvate formate lyase activating enzyme